jgi:hypothetical protein
MKPLLCAEGFFMVMEKTENARVLLEQGKLEHETIRKYGEIWTHEIQNGSNSTHLG